MSLIQDETMIQFLEMDEDFEEDLLEFDSPEGFGSSQDPNFLELNPLESDLLPSSLKSDLFLGENLSKSLWSIYSQGDLQIQAIFDSEHTPEDNEMINGVLREIANIEAQTKRKTTKQQQTQQQQQTIVMISESASSTPQSTIQTPPSTPIADGNRPPIINAPSRPYSPTSSKQQQSKKTTNTSSTAKANSGSVKRKSTTTTARKTDISKREPMREPVETPRRRTRRQHFEETFRLEEVLKIQVVEDDEDEEIDVC